MAAARCEGRLGPITRDTGVTAVRGPALRLAARAPDLEGLCFALETDRVAAPLLPGECRVAVAAAGVNPSDVKAALGAMPQAAFPRTPGRDFAGVVVDGPAALIGRAVWGSGGDLGITRDGSHAAHLVLPAAAAFAKPANLTMREAASVGVPFVTAQQGFAEAGLVLAGRVVLVLGANGRVGQAACQIAVSRGARVFAAVRRDAARAAVPPVVEAVLVDDVVAALRDATGGHGADLVFNCVGSPWFAAGNAAMAHGATQVFIATHDRAVPFDILAFYRGRHRYVGVDTLALDAAATGAVLDGLRPGFESGALRPYALDPAFAFPLHRAAEAYRIVAAGAPQRVLLDMAKTGGEP